MKRNLFKALLTIAIVAVLFSALAVTASAADVTVSTSGTCGADGDNLTWVLYSNGELVISGTGAMKDYRNFSSVPWTSYGGGITSVTIESGVTSLGNYAFSPCTNFTTIEIPASVTSIGYGAFEYCTKLKSVTVYSGIATFDSLVFSGTASDLVIYGGANSTAQKYAEKNGHTFSVIALPGVTAIGDCGSNAMWVLYDDGRLVIDGSGAISDYDSMPPWLNYRNSIKKVIVSDGITSIGNRAFYYCNAIESVDLPSALTSIGNEAFLNCTSLTSISIPSSIANIGSNAFNNCSNLNSVTVNNAFASFGSDVFASTSSSLVINSAENSTTHKYAVENSHDFDEIEIPKVATSGTCGASNNDVNWVLYTSGELVISGTGAMKDYSYSSSVPWYSYRSLITKVTVEDGVTGIGKYSFYKFTALGNTVLPTSIESIGSYAFYGCSLITSAELPKNVQSVGSYAFRYCEALTTVRVMGENTLFDTEVFYGTASKFEIHGYSGSIAEIYALDNGHKFVPILNLKFAGVSITLQNNIALSYRVDKEAFDALGYTDPYVVFEFDGSTKTVTNYTEKDGRYVFTFSNIIPGMLGENVKGTLCATYDGNTYASTAQNFSIAKYCYAMLDAAKGDEYAKLRTLLVDLLNYGAMAQIYTEHDTENLVNAALTEEQRAYGTQTAPELVSHLNTKHKTIDAPIAKWKAVSLILNDSVTVKLRISAENIEGLSLKAVVNDRTTLIPASSFVAAGENEYFIYFKGLVAKEFSDCIYFTVMDGETEVSNTLQYSVETYAYTSQTGSSTAALKNLTNAMMNYGKAAYAYEN